MKSNMPVLLLAMVHSSVSYAESVEEPPPPFEVVVQAGVVQPAVLRGGNVELDLRYEKWSVSYSHGFMLHLDGAAVVGEARAQGLAFDVPFSTGIGIGYRLFDWLELRAEAKWHRFRAHYADESLGDDALFTYDTYTIGGAAYAHWRPWKSRTDWLRGWNVSTSVRWWPTLASTLDDDRRSYDNLATGRTETHQALEIGYRNTPLILNVSLGYAFDLGTRTRAANPPTSRRWGVETELLQPFYPGIHIGRLRGSYTWWGDPSRVHGDLLAGVFIRPEVDHDVVDTINEYLLAIGYRQYFGYGVHADVAIEAGWAWGRHNLVDGRDYSNPSVLLDSNLGYRIDVARARGFGVYLAPQAGVIYGLATDIGPRGGKPDLFLQAKILAGVTL